MSDRTRALSWVVVGLVLFGLFVVLLTPGTFRTDALLVVVPLALLGVAVLALLRRAGGPDDPTDPDHLDREHHP
jgi:hypothetical protein